MNGRSAAHRPHHPHVIRRDGAAASSSRSSSAPRASARTTCCEEVGPEVDPLSPQNKLIFVVGPMAGTTMLGSNRYAVYFASPLTNGYCECYSGGNLTPQFARTGYKVVIVEGKADGPVYLEISEEGVRVPRRRRPLGPRRLRGRRRDRRAHRAQEGAGLRHRPGRREAGALRLRQQQQVAPARPRRPRRRVRQQEPQGHRLARRRPKVEVGAPRRVQGAGQGPGRAQQGRPRASPPTSAAARSTWCAS